ncbi:low temperature requirement protein A [Micromonospora sp. NPDC050397]|uniref:low temperature requirement protein A n=1 Tax=Micromonospora sp. NPDC050397 TaxID=3364279 RepID=UPI00384D67C0
MDEGPGDWFRWGGRMTGAGDIGLLRTEATSQRATFLELFFDLVFVFALTRVSQRLITDFSTDRRILFSEAGQTLLLFLALWLVWSFTALVTSRLDPDRPEIQFVVIASMFGAMVMAVAVPQGFNERAVVFAGAYVAVQLGRSVFLAVVHQRERILSLRVIFWLGMSAVLWLLGGVTAHHGVRGVLWTLAVALDFAGAASGWPTPKLGRSRVAEWSIAGEHLAERYQQFLLVTLGESILVIGLTFSGENFALDRTTAFLVAFLTTVLLWRVYFHRAGQLLPAAITSARQPARLGIAMTYTHLLMVAGIVLASVGYELFVTTPLGRTTPVWLYAILGGPVVFLAGRALFEYQVVGSISWPRIIGLVLLALIAPAMTLGHLPPVAIAAAVAAVLAGIVAADALRARGRATDLPTPPI